MLRSGIFWILFKVLRDCLPQARFISYARMDVRQTDDHEKRPRDFRFHFTIHAQELPACCGSTVFSYFNIVFTI